MLEFILFIVTSGKTSLSTDTDAKGYQTGDDVKIVDLLLLSTKSNFMETLRTIDMHVFVTFTDAEEESDALFASPPGEVYFSYGDYL